MPEILYIVIPCYNEAEVLPETSSRVAAKLKALKNAGLIARESRVLFVDDGSLDNTWQLIEALHRERPETFSGLKLSGNRGHQNALMAGLMTAKDRGDAVISMDADLQDDIDAVEAFLKKRAEGCEIVYGVRTGRKKDSVFKRVSAQCFYRMMALWGVNIVYNHADYRLMGRKALEALEGHREVNLFLRGMVPLLGFRSAQVTYHRQGRFAGESKYPLRKMLSFAWNGVSSFSVKPIRFVTALGFVVSFISVILMLYSFYQKFFGHTEPGWPTLMVSIWFLGGLQLLCLGIVGEYIGKIYAEVKDRPKYIIETLLDI